MGTQAQRHKLGRERDQRRALLKSLADSLLMHESIVTTNPKARALRPYVERMVTKAKSDTLARRRHIRRYINDDTALEKLFTDLAPRYQDRPGGYTRLSRAGYRRGDNVQLTRIAFVEQSAQANAIPVDSEATKSDDSQASTAAPAAKGTGAAEKQPQQKEQR